MQTYKVFYRLLHHLSPYLAQGFVAVLLFNSLAISKTDAINIPPPKPSVTKNEEKRKDKPKPIIENFIETQGTKIKTIPSLTKRDDAKKLYRIKLEWPEAKKAALFFHRDVGYMIFDKLGRLSPGTFPNDFFDTINIIPHKSALIIRFTLKENIDIQLAQFNDEWIILTGPMKNEMPGHLYPLNPRSTPDRKTISISNEGNQNVIHFKDSKTQDQFYVIPDRNRGIDMPQSRLYFDILKTYQGIALHNKAPNALIITMDKVHQTLILSLSTDMPLASKKPKGHISGNIPPLVDLRKYDMDQDTFLQVKRTLQDKLSTEKKTDRRLLHMEELAKFYMANAFYYEAAGILTLIKKQDPNHFYKSDPLLLLYDLAQILSHNIDDDKFKTNGGNFKGEPERSLVLAIHEKHYGHDGIALNQYIGAYKIIQKLPPPMRNDIALQAFDAAIHAGFKKPIFQSLVSKNILSKRNLDAFAYNLAQANRATDSSLSLTDTYSKLTFSPNKRVALLARLALLDKKTQSLKSLIKDLESLKFTWRGDILEQKFLATLSDLYKKNSQNDEALRCLRTIAAHLWKFEKSHIYIKLAEDLFYKSFMKMENEPLLKQLGFYYEFEDITPRGYRYGEILMRVTNLYMKVGLNKEAIHSLGRRLAFLVYERKRRTITLGEHDFLANMTYKRMAELYILNHEFQKSLTSLQRIKPFTDGTISPETLLAFTNDLKFLKATSHVHLSKFDKALLDLGTLDSIKAKRLRADIYMSKKDWVGAIGAIGDILKTIKDTALHKSYETDAILDMAVVASQLKNDEMTQALITEYADKLTDPEKRQAFNIITSSPILISINKKKLEEQINIAGRYEKLMDGIKKDIMTSAWVSDGKIESKIKSIGTKTTVN